MKFLNVFMIGFLVFYLQKKNKASKKLETLQFPLYIL